MRSKPTQSAAPPKRMALVPLLILLGVSAVATTMGQGLGSEIEVMCLTEQPAVVEGESAILRAWASGPDGQAIARPITFSWTTDAGNIDADGASARWNLASMKVPPNAARRVTATVTATRPGGSDARCVVEVQIGAKDAPVLDRGVIRGEELLSTKRYLFPGDVENPGYGLYSYVLLSAPPKNTEERARYLKTIEAYLLVLQNVDDLLARHAPPSSLNATYIPLREVPKSATSNAEWAANVLAVYDYATALTLLQKLKLTPARGPLLVSTLGRLSQSDLPARLHENLAGVTPELAWDWMQWFTYLAAQQRSWSETTLQRLGLNLRNVIAVGGRVTPQVVGGLTGMIQFMPKS